LWGTGYKRKDQNEKQQIKKPGNFSHNWTLFMKRKEFNLKVIHPLKKMETSIK